MAHLEAELLEDRTLLSASPPGKAWEALPPPAREVLLSPDGFGRMPSSLEVPGDATMFQFVAPFTGPLQVENHALPKSEFVTQMEVYDADGNPIDPTQFYRAGRHTVFGFDVVEGKSYFVKALAAPPADPPVVPPWPGSASEPVGDFELFFGPADDAGNDAQTAQRLPPVLGLLAGRLEVPSDVDRYLFVAPETGRLQVRWNLPQDGATSLRVLDAEDNRLPAAGVTPDGTLEFAVVAEQVYFLEMTQALTWPGPASPSTYELLLRMWTEQPPPPVSPGPTDGGGGPANPADPQVTGSGGDPGVTVMAAATDFFADVDLSRFLNGDPSPAVTGVLPLAGSGLALVGALLDGNAAAMMAAYFGSGDAGQGEALPPELQGDAEAAVVRANFKIGVQEAIRGRLTEARERWLKAGSEDVSAEMVETPDYLPTLARVVIDQATRLGDATMSLLQQVLLLGQPLRPAESAPPSAAPESIAPTPPQPPTPQSLLRDLPDPWTLGQATMALLVSFGVSGLWRGRSKRRSDRVGL